MEDLTQTLRWNFRVRMSRLVSVLFWLCALSPVCAAGTIRFAPLPMASLEHMTREYLPFLDYLEKQTGQTFELAYHASYETLLDALSAGQVDLAYLGPLPYVALTERSHNMQPVVQFLDAQGESNYTCALVHFADQPLTLIHPDRIQRFALTQPLSTCGYLMVEAYLQAQGESLENEQHEYTYVGSHEDVALKVILGRYDVGGLKTQIAQRYHHLGLRVIDETSPMPGFVLVANTDTLDTAITDQIRMALLELKPLENPSDAEVVRGWSANLKYGSIRVDEGLFDPVRQQWRQLKVDLIGAGQ
jgi:phosphonate transport system substrate-binding protein